MLSSVTNKYRSVWPFVSPPYLTAPRQRQKMFCDGNGLFWAMEESAFGPDSFFYDDVEKKRWVGFEHWPDDKFDAALEARAAYHGLRAHEQPWTFKRWKAVGDALRAKEDAQWHKRHEEWSDQRWPQQPRLQRQRQRQQERQQHEQEQHAGSAAKKQKH
jgi:hypothetical protein